jgi:hypothetical protein
MSTYRHGTFGVTYLGFGAFAGRKLDFLGGRAGRGFPQSSFGLGDPEKLLRKHKSGGLAHRAFCSQCGSSLFAIDDDGKNMSVTITTLDRPNLHRPEAVGYGGMAPRWLPTAALKKSSP